MTCSPCAFVLFSHVFDISHTPKIEPKTYALQGVTVSRNGRKFSCYPGGINANNTDDGTNGKYTVAELIGNNSERPYPNMEINNPPGGAINYSTTPATGANY